MPSPTVCKYVRHRHLCRGIWAGLPPSVHIRTLRLWARALTTVYRADQWAQLQPADASTEEAGSSGRVHLSPWGNGWGPGHLPKHSGVASQKTAPTRVSCM